MSIALRSSRPSAGPPCARHHRQYVPRENRHVTIRRARSLPRVADGPVARAGTRRGRGPRREAFVQAAVGERFERQLRQRARRDRRRGSQLRQRPRRHRLHPRRRRPARTPAARADLFQRRAVRAFDQARRAPSDISVSDSRENAGTRGMFGAGSFNPRLRERRSRRGRQRRHVRTPAGISPARRCSASGAATIFPRDAEWASGHGLLSAWDLTDHDARVSWPEPTTPPIPPTESCRCC